MDIELMLFFFIYFFSSGRSESANPRIDPHCMVVTRTTLWDMGTFFYTMVVCRSHDTAGSLDHGVSYPDPQANPDPLAKSRPTDKIQTHW